MPFALCTLVRLLRSPLSCGPQGPLVPSQWEPETKETVANTDLFIQNVDIFPL